MGCHLKNTIKCTLVKVMLNSPRIFFLIFVLKLLPIMVLDKVLVIWPGTFLFSANEVFEILPYASLHDLCGFFVQQLCTR